MGVMGVSDLSGSWQKFVRNLGGCFALGETEIKGCPVSRLGFNPDLSPMKFYNSLNESEPNARSFCARIQFIEKAKYAITEPGIDPYSVIPYKEDPNGLCGVFRLPD